MLEYVLGKAQYPYIQVTSQYLMVIGQVQLSRTTNNTQVQYSYPTNVGYQYPQNMDINSYVQHKQAIVGGKLQRT